jgi:hypothetical protein
MKLLFTLLTLTAACTGAHRDRGDDSPPDGGVDAPVCGSVTCDDLPAPACDGDTLVTYSAACEGNTCSYPATELACGPEGCCGDRCCGFAPSNGADFGGVTPTGLSVAPPNGIFNSSTECANPSALGACEVVTRADLGEACVCRADRFTIGDLRIDGTRALVLYAYKDVIVTGRLDVTGQPNIPGPGASYVYPGTPYKGFGGVGGSFGGVGGSNSNDRGVAAAYGDASLVPLVGGMSGEASGGNAGGGGGALQISARESIQITGTIHAGGGGGGGGASAESIAGGGGGGSGGAVLLEAQTVIVDGKILANGGGGGGGGGETRGGTDGWSAGTRTDPVDAASGGSGDSGGGCALYGTTSGGWGGTGARGVAAATEGGPSDSVSGCFNYAFVGGGGGGGGVGRIRINTKTGCQCGGTISPSATFGTWVTQ